MKTRTTFAIAAIALSLSTSLQAAPDARRKKQNHDRQGATTQQIDKSFDAIEKAVADARKQTTVAIGQRDAALKAIQDGKAAKSAAEKSRNEAETKASATVKAKADAEINSRKKLEASLNEANQKLANSTKRTVDLGNQVKAAEASKLTAEKQLAETKQKLDQANKALTVQLKTIADARTSAAASQKKQAEAAKNSDAKQSKPREEKKARRDKDIPKKGN